MASQVLSGTSNPSYTNNTGQNVRVVINYMAPQIGGNVDRGRGEQSSGITINWNGLSASASRPLASFTTSTVTGLVSVTPLGDPIVIGRSVMAGAPVALPVELILAPGQTFSAVCGPHNIVVIPENG